MSAEAPSPTEPTKPHYAGGVRRPDGTHGTPRRYSLRTIFIVTTCVAALLGLLRAMGTPPPILGGFISLVLIVGAAQALLFAGRLPRLASILGGVLWAMLVASSLHVVSSEWRPTGIYIVEFLCIVAVSPLLGYLSGGVVAGMFFILDVVEQQLDRKRQDASRDQDTR